jgi:hypothetical protein
VPGARRCRARPSPSPDGATGRPPVGVGALPGTRRPRWARWPRGPPERRRPSPGEGSGWGTTSVIEGISRVGPDGCAAPAPRPYGSCSCMNSLSPDRDRSVLLSDPLGRTACTRRRMAAPSCPFTSVTPCPGSCRLRHRLARTVSRSGHGAVSVRRRRPVGRAAAAPGRRPGGGPLGAHPPRVGAVTAVAASDLSADGSSRRPLSSERVSDAAGRRVPAARGR